MYKFVAINPLGAVTEELKNAIQNKNTIYRLAKYPSSVLRKMYPNSEIEIIIAETHELLVQNIPTYLLTGSKVLTVKVHDDIITGYCIPECYDK